MYTSCAPVGDYAPEPSAAGTCRACGTGGSGTPLASVVGDTRRLDRTAEPGGKVGASARRCAQPQPPLHSLRVSRSCPWCETRSSTSHDTRHTPAFVSAFLVHPQHAAHIPPMRASPNATLKSFVACRILSRTAGPRGRGSGASEPARAATRRPVRRRPASGSVMPARLARSLLLLAQTFLLVSVSVVSGAAGGQYALPMATCRTCACTLCVTGRKYSAASPSADLSNR